jgi:putative restriction endonuclease
MMDETGEKAEPMWGNKLYQRRAQKALPILVRYAQAGATVTYAKLAQELRMPLARNLNFVLGSIGVSIAKLSKAWGEIIPPLEALVVNAETGLPGAGVDLFITPKTHVVPGGTSGRDLQIADVYQSIFAYRKWPAVRAALSQAVLNYIDAQGESPIGPRGQRFWWVNHKQTHRQEIDGEYLWSPKMNQNGAKNESYNNMTKVVPRDVVFSFADAAIRAVGLVRGRAREAAKPTEFGAAGDQWGTDPGWQVPVRFVEFEGPLRPKDYAAEWAEVLPEKHSPIRANGEGNQGIYLAAIPTAMVEVVRRLLGGQLEKAMERLEQDLGPELADEAVEETIHQRTDIGPREKARLVSARRGQGIYRDNLEQIEKRCRVTGIADGRYLQASHIKPWCKSDDREKIDGYNGLLLAPHVDLLFDRGWISFSDDGKLLLSETLDLKVLGAWGIPKDLNVGQFRSEQCQYLAWHREAFGFAS